MKLMDIIEATINTRTVELANRLFAKAETECSEAMKFFKQGKFLVRGMKGGKGFAHIGSKHSSKRSPIDVDSEFDEYVEEFRQKNYPKVPSRQYSLFAVPMIYDINFEPFGQYGINHVILPVNGSKYFQSKRLFDFMALAVTSYDLFNNIDDNHDRLQLNTKLNNYFRNSNNKFSEIDFNQTREVIIETPKYYAFHHDLVEGLYQSVK